MKATTYFKQNFDKSAKAWSVKLSYFGAVAVIVLWAIFVIGFVLGVAGSSVNSMANTLTEGMDSFSVDSPLYNNELFLKIENTEEMKVVLLIFSIPAFIGFLIGRHVPESIGYDFAWIMDYMMLSFALVILYGTVLKIVDKWREKKKK